MIAFPAGSVGNVVAYVRRDGIKKCQVNLNRAKFSFSRKMKSLDKRERELHEELEKLISEAEIQKVKMELNEISKHRIIINQGQATYRKELHTITTTAHPFTLESKKQSSGKISEELHNSLSALHSVVSNCNIDDKRDALGYFERQIEPLSSLTDLWWQWIETDLSFQIQDVKTKNWVKEYLLPYVYWQQQVKKSKSTKSLREFYTSIYSTAEKKLEIHALTEKLGTDQTRVTL